MKFELNEQVINNLKAFLLRVDLKGSEVGAYCEIINALTPINEVDKEENTNNSNLYNTLK